MVDLLTTLALVLGPFTILITLSWFIGSRIAQWFEH